MIILVELAAICVIAIVRIIIIVMVMVKVEVKVFNQVLNRLKFLNLIILIMQYWDEEDNKLAMLINKPFIVFRFTPILVVVNNKVLGVAELVVLGPNSKQFFLMVIDQATYAAIRGYSSSSFNY